MTGGGSRGLSVPRQIGLVGFGILSAFLILEGALRVAGFALLQVQAHRNAVSLRREGAYRILCIGESTTQGQYPAALERELNGRGAGVRFSVIDRGFVGAQTSFLVDRLEADLDAYRPDLVLAMMGINDGGAHMPYPPAGAAPAGAAEAFALRFKTYKLMCIAGQRLAALAGKARDGGAPGGDPAGRGRAYRDRGDFARAIPQFQEALERDPHDCEAYEGLGWSYQAQGRLKEAEAVLNAGLAENPRGAGLCVVLGWIQLSQARFADAAGSFLRALDIQPGNDEAYAGLGAAYQGRRDFPNALRCFKKALELNPRNERALEGALGSALFSRTDASWWRRLAERGGREGSALDDRVYGALATAYAAMGDQRAARRARGQAEALRSARYAPSAARNYRRLKELLDRRGVRLAAAQYPMRGIAPLQEILRGHEAGVVFIDNEGVFRAAVEKDSFQAYFTDMFGGDFGHCTDRGNELLARNMADVILREVFGP